MDISKSKFYINSDTSTDLFSTFIYAWNEAKGTKNNKYFMDKIINNIKSLKSKGKIYEESDDPEGSDLINSNFVLDRYDPTFKKLSDYFSNNTREELSQNPIYKHLRKKQLDAVILTKICVMIYLHTNSFFLNYGEYLNIDKSLVCKDGTPVIDAIYQDIERTKKEIADQMKELFDSYPEIKDKLDYHDILRVPRAYKAAHLIDTLSAEGVFKNEDELIAFKRKINNIRSLYIEDKFYFRAKNLFDIYQAVSASFYDKHKDQIPGILRGLVPESSFYAIQSDYVNTNKLDS